ncbi:MFS transporter [Listeria newyorkensis]|uniref:MFS transporter n=1 Tax=Listeria newyorkensis TaxID=1497681 RepID=A0ABX4XXX9_9LIST|nr:MFS transporter [Listeria newyorkensis]KGL43862.1 MFS transporter [Listeria newyorkensis]PNP95004.1 MFS transporter [Listeria newyorkensis]WAO21934.1 MFS transporter [Listeria newyorkensis]SQC59167.1 Bacillibactin exporter [Listeria newyorkensis]
MVEGKVAIKKEDGVLKSLLHQPKSALAVAFSCVVAFMGIGLVDPILKSISEQLHATPAQTSLLFTSYMLVTGIVMLFTGFISSRIGAKKTLLIGLVIIIIFAGLGGLSQSVGQLVGLRAGWGLGNALFISTALATIIAVSSGATEKAIIMYEAAMGLGMSVGPLVGGLLGSITWRAPFFGVATLMAIGFVAIIMLLDPIPKPKVKSKFWDSLRALRHKGLLVTGLTALFYNFGFFTLLAYSPFLMVGYSAIQVGLVFFGWGLMLAISSVFVAPRLEEMWGTKLVMMGALGLFAVVLVVMGIGANDSTVISVCIVIAGFFQGINNTLITSAVMVVSPVERATASSAYSFIRFTGGAIAPWLAGSLAVWFNPHVTFYVAGFAVLIGIIILLAGRKALSALD